MFYEIKKIENLEKKAVKYTKKILKIDCKRLNV